MQLFGEISLAVISFMAAAAFFAGFVDAIAGGGGLIQLPALLIGLPESSPAQALGTNKLGSIFGTSAAARIYARKVRPDWRATFAMAIPAFIGSMGGALCASQIPSRAFRPLVFILLLSIAIYTWRKPTLGQGEHLRHTPKRRALIAAVTGGSVGFYDGIFGPGTGTFLMLVLVAVLGFAFLTASSMAKVVNFSTNLGAIAIFGFQGVILWRVGLLLGIANVAGAILGARFAIRGGSSVVRKVFLAVTFVLIIKVGIDTITYW